MFALFIYALINFTATSRQACWSDLAPLQSGRCCWFIASLCEIFVFVIVLRFVEIGAYWLAAAQRWQRPGIFLKISQWFFTIINLNDFSQIAVSRSKPLMLNSFACCQTYFPWFHIWNIIISKLHDFTLLYYFVSIIFWLASFL